MTPDAPASIERLYDLLADRATVGLTAAEEAELDSLLSRWPHVDPDDFDRAAAAVHLTAAAPLPLPPALQAKLEADARAHFGGRATPRAGRRGTAFYWAVAGWSCAATVLVGVLVLQLARRGPAQQVVKDIEPPKPVAKDPDPPKALTVAERRDRLEADPTTRAFVSAAKAKAPTGRVVFNPAKQEGYMELRGLKPNDPAKRQYQLWVVDKGRPHKEPVDGGVFDVNPDGTALVPVRSPLVLRDVAAFAVTEEPPGGVVVSEAGKRGEFVVVMTP